MGGRNRLYLSYAVRSLRRGGQRSILAIFCVAVGVMAVVALRLAGDMVTLSLTSNVRDVNGGDISVQSTALPLGANDLGPLTQLKQRGAISDYIALGTTTAATVRRTGGGHTVTLPLYVVDDPSRFPLVGSGTLNEPQNATYAQRLRANTIVVSQFVSDEGALHAGDRAHVTISGGEGTDVTVAGVAANRRFAGQIAVGYITRSTYDVLRPGTPPSYGLVEITTPTADAAPVADQLRRDYPAATVVTVQDAIDTSLQASTDTSRFLQIVGLLALLIGGVGIVNTMQVMLSRRRVEIAMLKTAGYKRRDLYSLFAVEAGMIGLSGGLLGTAVGTGLSAVVRILVQNLFQIPITFHVSAGTLLTGVAVGVATSLIFGLLPIVRAAGVRPVTVLRDMGEATTTGTRAQTAGLYLLLVALFTALSAGLLGSVQLAVAVVAGTIVVILLLAGIFAAIITAVGRIPVPERPGPLQWGVAIPVLLLAIAVTAKQRAVGTCLLIVAIALCIAVALPRSRRTAVKLALRSLSRARGRTTATLVALFAGVFTIGLILVLGQNITTKIENGISRATTFNVFAIASARDAQRAGTVTQRLQGVQERRVTQDIATTPTQVNGRPLSDVLPSPAPTSGNAREGNQFRLAALAGIEGYDLAHNQLPDTDARVGRVLTPQDAGTTNVMLRNDLRTGDLHLHVGDTVTVKQAVTGTTTTLTVVGFYTPVSRTSSGLVFRTFFNPIVGDVSLIRALGAQQAQTVIGMKLDPQTSRPALTTLENSLPDATIINLADFGTIVDEIVSNLVNLLVALASLALFAGIIIIANAVALAMLERRREIGILKAVGHTSSSVLAQVLVENGATGAIAGIAGMLLVTVATALLGAYVLDTDLTVGGPIVAAVAVGVTALTVLTAALVAWSPTRARPLEVLRYE